MKVDISWHLPLAYREPEVASRLSADAQIYLRCFHCRAEYRIDPQWFEDFTSFDGAPCKQCGMSGLEFVRHLEKRKYRCRSCDADFYVRSTWFNEDNCGRCGSSELALLSCEIQPPFPAVFWDIVRANDKPWGISVFSDMEFMRQSTQSVSFLPDFSQYLLVDILFSERLRKFGGYEDTKGSEPLLRFEAGLYRNYFKRTREIQAGLRSLSLYEESLQQEQDPIEHALVEHNIAMAIYSLLSRFSEDYIGILSERPDIRYQGISAANSALAFFTDIASGSANNTEAEIDQSFIRTQCARIHHIIGDLCKVGNVSQTDLRLAIDHLSKAISSDALSPRQLPAARESRATAITRLQYPEPFLVQQAVDDFKAGIELADTHRGLLEKWICFHNLASLYETQGQYRNAIKHAEFAASMALQDLKAAMDEQTLIQKERQYGPLFEQIARLYVWDNRPKAALSALESFRGMTLRINTMSQSAQQARVEQAAKRAIDKALEQLLGLDVQHETRLRLDNVLPRLKPLRVYLKDSRTAIISLSVSRRTVTAIIVARPRLLGGGIESRQWDINTVSIKTTLALYMNLDPSPLRERRLTRLCDQAYQALLKPLAPLIEHRGLTRVGLVAPSPIAQIPFEALPANGKYPEVEGSRPHFFYLPSIMLGSDLVHRKRIIGPSRMLLVGYMDEDLSGTLEEVARLREIFEGRITVVDTTRYPKRIILRQLQGEYDYIHFTCHGSFDPVDPLSSALHLIRDSSNDSYRIAARDLLDTRLPRCPVVSMSACSTALTAIDASNTYAGLTGSFLRSGARCVVGARWPVYDEVAMAFMIAFYGRLAREDANPFDSFCDAQRLLGESAGIEDWAAFSYVGIP